jgi:tape measure domain-containing protein
VIDRKEVELLVRARLQGKADLATVTKEINAIGVAIDKQTAAAKKGEASIDELKATLLGLQTIQDKLANQASLVGTFQRVEQQLAKTSERVDQAGRKYRDYADRVNAAGVVTEKQQDRLVRLSAAYDAAQARLATQTASLGKLRAALTEAGIATTDLANAELKIRDGAAQIGTSIAKVQQAVSTYAVDLREARTAAKLLADEERDLAAQQRLTAQAAEAAAQALERNRQLDNSNNIRNAAEAARRGAEYIRFWREELDKLDKSNNELQATADSAEKAARGFTTLARASTDLRTKVQPLRDVIAGILNPAQAARQSLSGVEDEIRKIATAAAANTGPIKDYQGQLTALGAASKALVQQAGLVENFRRQTEALRAARAEYVAARAQVAQYAAAVRQGGESGAGFTEALQKAQVAARNAALALNDQLVATRTARTELRSAGIATNDLANAQQRLTAAARQSSQALIALGNAKKNYGEATERATRSTGLFRDEGRTTLSLVQRIRGEILALAAAYVGVQGAVNLASGSISAFNTREGAKNQLSISVGSNRDVIDAEYAYVKGQADRIGVEFERAIRGYAKFSAAASLAGRGRQEVRAIFETFTEVSRVANLSADDLDGVFKALEQIFSKGKIQAEELRGQLGDRLFGAFQIAAQSLKDQFPDLDKALKDGLVTSDQLVKIAERYRQIIAGELPAAQQSIAAEQMRFNNAVFEFKTLIADGGFADSFKAALLEINEFLRGEGGKRLAQNFSDGFTLIGKAVVFVLNNLELLKTAAASLLIIFAAKQVAQYAVALTQVSRSAKELTGIAGALSKALSVLQVFLLAFNVGSWLYEQFPIVRQAGAYLVATFEATWAYLKFGVKAAFEALPQFIGNGLKRILSVVKGGLAPILVAFRALLLALGKGELVAAFDKALDALTTPLDTAGDRIAQFRRELDTEIAQIKSIYADMVKDINAPAVKAPRAVATATPIPTGGGGGKSGGPSEADIKRRQSLIESIRRQLESLDASIDRAEKASLGQQLEAVDTQFAKLQRDIDKVGGREGADFTKTLETLKGEKKLQIVRAYNLELVKEQEALQSKLEAVDAAAGRKDKESLDARLQAITDSYAATYRDIEAFRQRLDQAGASDEPAQLAKERLDLGLREIRQLETQKFYKDELTRREQELADVQATRAARIKSITDQEEAGLITSQEADTQRLAAIAALQPQVEALAQSGAEFAASLNGAFDPVKLQTFLATLNLAVGSGQRLAQSFQFTKTQIDGMIANGAVTAIDSMAKAAGEAANNQISWSDALKETGKAFLKFAADFLREIALMIIRALVLKAIQNSSIGGAVAGAANVAVSHSGGMVGSSNRSRNVPTSWFAAAPRYHQGGLPGLGAREHAIIAEEGEEVLSKDSPRNILNGGGLTAAKSDGGSNRFVLVDDRSRVSEAMNTPEGEKVTLVHLKSNLPSIKQWLGL